MANYPSYIIFDQELVKSDINITEQIYYIIFDQELVKSDINITEQIYYIIFDEHNGYKLKFDNR